MLFIRKLGKLKSEKCEENLDLKENEQWGILHNNLCKKNLDSGIAVGVAQCKYR